MDGLSHGVGDKWNAEDIAYRQILHTHLVTILGELCSLHGATAVKIALAEAERENNEENL